MVVLSKSSFIFEDTGLTCDVSAFSPNLPVTKLPIVDAVIAYDCLYKMQSYLLMIRNALYVDSMLHNLIPPFIMREARLILNETAKIHVAHPDESNYSIYCPDDSLRIPLSLHGIFSFFHYRKPTLSEINNLNVIFLTPDASHWNLDSDHFEKKKARLWIVIVI